MRVLIDIYIILMDVLTIALLVAAVAVFIYGIVFLFSVF